MLGELQQLKTLINNLLDLAQTEANVPLTDEVRLDEAAVGGARGRSPAQRARVRVDLGDLAELPADPAAFVVPGHRALLARALGNLVDNALKYSADDRRVLSLRCPAGGPCVVRVADAGMGIAPEDLAAGVSAVLPVGGGAGGRWGTGWGCRWPGALPRCTAVRWRCARSPAGARWPS
ncbi:MAG: HAMP domain-containing sensor histidine kinase [Hymenobacter sp.]